MRANLRTRAHGVVILAAMLCVVAAACGSDDSSNAKADGTTGGGSTGAKLFPTNFEGVCQGASQSKATAYDKAAATHKVVYFETYKDSLLDQSSSLPTDWTVQFDANADAYAAVDLVACAVRTSDAFVKECDGYEKDNKPTKNKVRVHTAKYTVTVHQATTGAELAKTEISGDNDTCPMIQSFDGDNQTVDSYSSPTKETLVAFIKPFAQP